LDRGQVNGGRHSFRIPNPDLTNARLFSLKLDFSISSFRRLGVSYSAAKLLIVVGDRCDIDLVRFENK
jgi:hypothetical protein